jgi:hypothetical protein
MGLMTTEEVIDEKTVEDAEYEEITEQPVNKHHISFEQGEKTDVINQSVNTSTGEILNKPNELSSPKATNADELFK